jgi:hypothetical protein
MQEKLLRIAGEYKRATSLAQALINAAEHHLGKAHADTTDYINELAVRTPALSVCFSE